MSLGGQRMRTLWPLVQRHWFDLAIVLGAGVSIVVAVDQGKENGPEGPLWFDLPASVVFLVPLLARRRYPFGAPAVCVVLLAATSFIDPGLTSDDVVMFLAALASAVLFGMLKERAQAVAGLAIVLGVVVIVQHNDPTQSLEDSIWSLVTFSVAWAVGFGLGHKFRETDEAKRASRASGAGPRGEKRERPSPRSARESPASCTTSSVTASAS